MERKYNFTVRVYSAQELADVSNFVTREKNCNGFTATIIGDTAARVNGKILFPSATPATDQGDSFSFGGNEDEIYMGNIQVQFAQPLGANPIIEIVQKFYI